MVSHLLSQSPLSLQLALLFQGLHNHVSMDDNGWCQPECLLIGHGGVLLQQVVHCLSSDDTNLFGDSASSGGLVTSNHNDLNTGGLAFLNGEWHSFLWWIH